MIMSDKKGAKKVAKVMKEYAKGDLHSGSKEGPTVTAKKQAIAIALSEAGQSKKQTTKKRARTATISPTAIRPGRTATCHSCRSETMPWAGISVSAPWTSSSP
jgi:hypothetical protein